MPTPATPDVEAALVAFLTAQLPSDTSMTEAPGDLDSLLPFHRITVVTGLDLAPTLGQVAVDIDSWAVGRPAANSAALAVKDVMTYKLPGHYDSARGAAFGFVESSTWPAWRPWDNTNLRRVGATYLLVVHAFVAA